MAVQYHVLSVDLLTGDILGELPVSDLSFGYVLNGAGSTNIILPLSLPQSSNEVIIPGRTGLHVYRNRVPVWAGICWGARVQLIGQRQEFSVDGAEYWSYFLQGTDTGRYIREDLIFSGYDQLLITQELIEWAQKESIHGAGANLGISVRAGESGVERDADWFDWDYKVVGEAVVEMAEMVDGFDFHISLGGELGQPLTKQFRMAYPRQADDSYHHVIDNVQALAKLDYEVDALRMARRFIIKGSGSGAAGVEAEAVADNTDYIYREHVSSFTDEDYEEHLGEHAQEAALQFGRPPQIPKLVLYNDVGGQWVGTVKPGDFVDVDLDLGYTRLVGSWRIVKLDVGWNGGVETVALILNEDLEAHI